MNLDQMVPYCLQDMLRTSADDRADDKSHGWRDKCITYKLSFNSTQNILILMKINIKYTKYSNFWLCLFDLDL